MLDLAAALLAASQAPSSAQAHGAALINENLRLSLTRFAGAEGFASLLRRAVTLAAATMPALSSAKVRADGRIEGIERILAQDEGTRQAAAVAITVQLLELLVIFIGEPLTRRLVREACPEVSPDA
jgi:hypothetical protein